MEPAPTLTITVPASEKTAAAMERMHRMYLTQRERLDVPDPEPRPPGRPWSKTVRTEQQQAAVSAAQAKRDRRAARNLSNRGRERLGREDQALDVAMYALREW